jgi:hypothetical protein
MAKQTINVGTSANDRTGDPLRTAFTKVNSNFTEVYNNVAATNTLVTNNNNTVNNRINNLDISDLSDSEGLLANIPTDLSDLTDSEGLLANIPTDLSDLTDNENLLAPSPTLPYVELTNEAFITQAISFGPGIDFIKLANVPNTDFIDTNLALTRGSMRGLYNPELEEQYDSVNHTSPAGTEWNSEGWNDMINVRTREYTTLRDALGGAIGENIVEKRLIMHDMINGKYYQFYFIEWGQDNGGSFVYNRRLIEDPNYFVKTDNGNEIDIFVADDGDGGGIGITRDNSGGIYNPYREEGWDVDVSPSGTLWNIDGWNDLSNIQERTYLPFNEVYSGDLDNRIPGSQSIMNIQGTETYYAIQWVNWTQNNNGGGFSYIRYEIDNAQVNEGIKFSDGTSLKSAKGLSRVKSTANFGRAIEEISGSHSITVSAIVTTNLTTTASRNAVNSSQISISISGTTIDNIINSPSTYNITDSSSIQFSIDNTNWYTWSGGISYPNEGEESYGLSGNPSLTYDAGDTVYFRYKTGGEPVVWWDKNELPEGSGNFRGAVIDYHAYTGEGTWIGTIHIVDDSGDSHITHTEVSSGSSDMENDDLWVVNNEGTISYRRLDGETKILRIHWTARVFYGTEYYGD